MFLEGQELWVTNIDVKDNGVVFALYTDAYDGERFIATLTFHLLKGRCRRPKTLRPWLPKYLRPQAPRHQPAPAERKPVRQEAPPPPIDPPPASSGRSQEHQSGDDHRAGRSQFWATGARSFKLGAKQIYAYKDLKVTLVNNKVTDVK